jgi:hypothetical protein
MIRGQQQVQQHQQQQLQHHGQEVGALSANLLAERDKRIEVQVELDILKADHAAEAGQQPFFRRAEINFCKVESMELIPTLGDTVMTQKMAETKDTFIMSRTIVTALSQDPPDVELATDLAGQLCRLANNKLVGFKIATGSNIDPKKKYAVPDLYYEATGPAAKRTKLEWLPPPLFVHVVVTTATSAVAWGVGYQPSGMNP